MTPSPQQAVQPAAPPVTTAQTPATPVATPLTPSPAGGIDYAAARAATGARLPSVLDKYPPVIQSLAPQIASYSLKLPQGAALKFDPKTGIDWPTAIKAATEYAGMLPDGTPAFDQKQYETRQNFQKQWAELKNTSAGGKLATANKLISHLGELMDASDALHNTPVKPLNYLVNGTESNLLGDPRVGNFRTAAQHVGEESANFFGGGGTGSEGQRAASGQSFNEDAGPEIQKGAARTTIKLVSGQIAPYREQYIKVMGRPPKDPILDPRARAIIQRIGLDPDQVETGGVGQNLQNVTNNPTSVIVETPHGPMQFKDQETANKYKAAAGLK